jgi:hypothetical protein
MIFTSTREKKTRLSISIESRTGQSRTSTAPVITQRPLISRASGGEWHTLSENLYRAYLNTGDPKYKTFAAVWHYGKYWGDLARGHPQVALLHAYSHVNTLSSAAMTYGVLGDPFYLKAIVNAYDYLQQTQCFATGGYGPAERLRAADGSLGDTLTSLENTFETPCGRWAAFKLSLLSNELHWGSSLW